MGKEVENMAREFCTIFLQGWRKTKEAPGLISSVSLWENLTHQAPHFSVHFPGFQYLKSRFEEENAALNWTRRREVAWTSEKNRPCKKNLESDFSN